MRLGHPQLIKFNEKYEVLLDYYTKGYCTLNEFLEAIEILEKYWKD